MRKSKAEKRDTKRKLRREENKIVENFCKKLAERQKDLPEWASKTIDKHFWELS